MSYIIVIILIILSAIFSGLTLGFFSLNLDSLKRKAQLGNKDARKVFKIRKKGNLLLCTLLVGNVAVNSAIAIFLGTIASGFIAGLVATTLIVILGEIVPQATFSRHALILGSRFSWLVNIFIYILFPVCWPIAWALNKALGGEAPTIYSKQELIKIIEDHEDLHQSDIDEDEENIVRGALSYSSKKAKDVMTPKEKVFYLEYDTIINQPLIEEIKEQGASRIPVYKKSDDSIVGILYIKDLIDINLRNKKVGLLARKKITVVNNSTRLDDILNLFRRTKSHLFIVQNNAKKFAGIITIEDVIEEIIGKEILDEYDD